MNAFLSTRLLQDHFVWLFVHDIFLQREIEVVSGSSTTAVRRSFPVLRWVRQNGVIAQ